MSVIKIEVTGQGRRFCRKLYALVDEVVYEVGVDAEVTHLSDFKQVIRYIPLTQVLRINGETANGGLFPPSKEKLRTSITE